MRKKILKTHPLDIATAFQRQCGKISKFCQGLLGGFAFGHLYFIVWSAHSHTDINIKAEHSMEEVYCLLFYVLNVIALVNVLDLYDVAHWTWLHVLDFISVRRRVFVILLYSFSLLAHLACAKIDDDIMYYRQTDDFDKLITKKYFSKWVMLSNMRGVAAVAAWMVVAMCPFTDLLLYHLKHMQKYNPWGVGKDHLQLRRRF